MQKVAYISGVEECDQYLIFILVNILSVAKVAEVAELMGVQGVEEVAGFAWVQRVVQ